MSKEEKNAIKNMKIFARVHEDMAIVTAEDMNVVLNLIEKQQREIRKFTRNEFKRSNRMLNLISMHSYDKEKIKNKDKTIDLMTKEILRLDVEKSKFEYDHAKMWDTETGIKEYFTKKASESNE